MAEPTVSAEPGTGMGDRRPVLFLALPMAINVRDVLRSDAWTVLREGDADLHLFMPAGELAAAEEEFGGDGVCFHPLRRPRSALFDLLDAAVLKYHVLLLSLRSDTVRIMIVDTLRNPVARALRWLVGSLGRRAQDALLAASGALVRRVMPEVYGPLFERLRPDLVVGTRTLTMTDPRAPTSPRVLDRYMVMEAARRGVPTMVLVASWDNLTGAGFFPADVTAITVWNEIMREQAETIHGVKADRILVTGAPQHDIYAAAPAAPREAFLREVALDPAAPLVVYTTTTEGLVPDEPEIVMAVVERLRTHRPGIQVLVRLHQLDRAERYERLGGAPGVSLDQAGTPPAGGYQDREFDRRQLQRLADTLRHADVVVNVASSIAIDATAVGTPVVFVEFDASEGASYRQSVRRFYDYTHLKRLVASGGVRRARSMETLVAAVEAYLDDPTLDAEGRARLVREQCGRLDGRSGRRVGEAVLRVLSASADRPVGP